MSATRSTLVCVEGIRGGRVLQQHGCGHGYLSGLVSVSGAWVKLPVHLGSVLSHSDAVPQEVDVRDPEGDQLPLQRSPQ